MFEAVLFEFRLGCLAIVFRTNLRIDDQTATNGHAFIMFPTMAPSIRVSSIHLNKI